jgi:hypothetical protein
VEACTVIEVTVRQAVKSRVEQCGDQAVSDLIIGQKNTLGTLLRLARKLEIALPDTLNDVLVTMRNNVVHQGTLPSPDETLLSWQTAYWLIQQHAPLLLPSD